MDNLECVARCRSVGTADGGTAPGSVSVVLACVANANDDNTMYGTYTSVGMECDCANHVTVRLE
jgi:hypothetical protein